MTRPQKRRRRREYPFSPAIVRAMQHTSNSFADFHQAQFETSSHRNGCLEFDDLGNIRRFRNDDGLWLDVPNAIQGVIAAFREHASDNAAAVLSRQVQRWLHEGLDEASVCKRLGKFRDDIDEHTRRVRLSATIPSSGIKKPALAKMKQPELEE